ncbi:unnamed protein product [Orchesella dallaii]|uniref:Uncharacterized protein n=1 Tax=Orchesella dallaii TaxID=48710 RepID=A0ABP1PIM4_9HEXA
MGKRTADQRTDADRQASGGLTIWNTILTRINTTSVIPQKESIDVDYASRHLESLLNWLAEFSETGFQECLLKAKAKASSIGITEDTGFQYQITRNQLPKRFRQQHGVHDVPTTKSNVEKFKEEFFDSVMEKDSSAQCVLGAYGPWEDIKKSYENISYDRAAAEVRQKGFEDTSRYSNSVDFESANVRKSWHQVVMQNPFCRI